jgi:hypothetical protein
VAVSKIRVHFPIAQDEDGYPPVALESLWAATCNQSGLWRIENIPFFARAATLDDVISVRFGEDGHWFDGLVHQSGNSLLRVSFEDRSIADTLACRLEDLGCAIERISAYNIFAVSVPPAVALHDVRALLGEALSTGEVDYEEAILRHED